MTRYAARDRVLVRFTNDPVLYHARWVLADQGDVAVEGHRGLVQVVTALTPDRAVEDLRLGPPTLSEVVRWTGARMPNGIRRKSVYDDRYAEAGPYDPEELGDFYANYAGKKADGSVIGVAPKVRMRAKGPAQLGGAPPAIVDLARLPVIDDNDPESQPHLPPPNQRPGRAPPVFAGAALAREDGPWFCAAGMPGFSVGDVVDIEPGAEFTRLGDKALLRLSSGACAGQVVVLERVPGLESQDYRDKAAKAARDEFGGAAPAQPQDGGLTPRDDPKADAGDEARVLSVVFNQRGARVKPFADAVSEQVEDQYRDWPLVDGERTMLWIVEKMQRDGLAPLAWVEAYLSRKKYADSDRAQHELRIIARVWEIALCYDQLNICGLACMEVLARRWQLIVAAHARDAAAPSYAGSEFYVGDDVDDCVAPNLREKVTKSLATQAKVVDAHHKVMEMKNKLARPGGKAKGAGKADKGDG